MVTSSSASSLSMKCALSNRLTSTWAVHGWPRYSTSLSQHPNGKRHFQRHCTAKIWTRGSDESWKNGKKKDSRWKALFDAHGDSWGTRGALNSPVHKVGQAQSLTDHHAFLHRTFSCACWRCAATVVREKLGIRDYTVESDRKAGEIFQLSLDEVNGQGKYASKIGTVETT